MLGPVAPRDNRGTSFQSEDFFLFGRLRFLEPGSRPSFARQALGQLRWPAIPAASTTIGTDPIAYGVLASAEKPAFDHSRFATRDW
jgi:hypothetical protein